MKSYTRRPDTFTLNFNLLFQVHVPAAAVRAPAREPCRAERRLGDDVFAAGVADTVGGHVRSM